MRLVLAGTPAPAVPALRALLASRHEVAAVLTRPDAAAGRGRRSLPSPVRLAAAEAGLEVLTPQRVRDPDLLDRLRRIAPDCCPVVAYGALIPPAALGIPPHGWVNVHFSVLPAWRGAAPVQRAIAAGDAETGVTVFRLDEGLDTGPVLATMVEPLRPRDTAGEVLDRLATAGADLLVRVLDAVEAGALQARPQAADGVSHAPKVTVTEARVDFGLPAHVVDRRIRAVTPEPGAWTTVRGDRVRLGPVTVSPDPTRLAPATVAVHRREVLVGTGTSAVVLGAVQPPGRRPMPAPDWARGVRDLDGTVLGASA
ncbi:MAG: methionyl-tRNA formyltransferase [Kineosporiaceae bacterium]